MENVASSQINLTDDRLGKIFAMFKSHEELI